MATSVLFSDPRALDDPQVLAVRPETERKGEDYLRDQMVLYQRGDPAAVDAAGMWAGARRASGQA